MAEFLGTVDIKNSAGSKPGIKLDGGSRDIILYGHDGKVRIKIGEYTDLEVGGKSHYSVLLMNDDGEKIADLSLGYFELGGNGITGAFSLLDELGDDSIGLNASNNSIAIKDKTGRNSIVLDGANKAIGLTDEAGRNSISLDGRLGDVVLRDIGGKHSFGLHGNVDGYTGLWLGASTFDEGGAKAGYLEIRNASGNPSMILNGTNNSIAIRNEAGENNIILDGASGDIILANADCAEDFDIQDPQGIEPGTVMVIEQKGKLQQSNIAYDKRVVGVVSGALNYKPGLVLDKRRSTPSRKSISLMGKVFCKADAQYGSIDVGDLLTTSNTPGHAMKATDPMKAFGSVIGKALGSLNKEIGLIPILVTLQ